MCYNYVFSFRKVSPVLEIVSKPLVDSSWPSMRSVHNPTHIHTKQFAAQRRNTFTNLSHEAA